MDVPGRQVLNGSTALVLVFDAHGLMRTGRDGRLGATTHLDVGLLTGADHVLAPPGGPASPTARVQTEHGAAPSQKVGTAGKDPVAIPPRTQGIVAEPPPHT